jgi:hypothetical protein
MVYLNFSRLSSLASSFFTSDFFFPVDSIVPVPEQAWLAQMLEDGGVSTRVCERDEGQREADRWESLELKV